MKSLRFSQHIRTSSKSRKGFRTYQKSADILENVDEMLSAYGAYIPTAYTIPKNISDYPKLFSFYQIPNGDKVICLAEYVGNDLHSYPARAGNYLSHSLVYKGNEPFNLLQVYLEQENELNQNGQHPTDLQKINDPTDRNGSYLDKKSGKWKAPKTVEKEDENANAPFEIEEWKMNIDTQWYEEPFEVLFAGDDSRRRTMFLIAVRAIIRKERIILVDEGDKLIHWTFALLQSFPAEFVFERLRITSFSNCNLLADVCNVLCIELEMEDRMTRYQTDGTVTLNFKHCPTTINDFFSKRNEKVVDEMEFRYAKILLEAGISNKLSTFRNQIDTDFKKTPSTTYSLVEFNINAEYLESLFRIKEMSSNEFKSFYAECATSDERKKDIFEQIILHQDWKKCRIIWEEIDRISPVKSLDDLIYLNGYSNSPDTDADWLEFETQKIQKIDADSNKLSKYWDSILVYNYNPERANVILNKVILLTSSQKNYHSRKKELFLFKDLFEHSNEENRRLLSNIRLQIERIEEMIEANPEKRIKAILKHITDLEEKDWQEVMDHFPTLKWETLFKFSNHTDLNDTLIRLYESGKIDSKLPFTKNVALIILRKEYVDNPGLFYDYFKILPYADKEEITQFGPKELKKIINDQRPIDSIEDLEKALESNKDDSSEKLIVGKFIETVLGKKTTFLLWELAEIIDKNNKEFKHVRKLSQTSLLSLYKRIEDEAILIPPGFEKLAQKLVNNKIIDRPIPKDNLITDSTALLDIGVLSDLKEIKKIIPDRSLRRSDIENIVKLPWEHYTWRWLYENLNPNQRAQLSNLIGDQLSWIKQNPNGRVNYSQWCMLACEYLIFLIVSDMYQDLIFCISQRVIILDWGEYEYISNRLLCLMPNHKNRSYVLFDNPANKNKSMIKQMVANWSKNGEGPIWKPDGKP